MTNLEYYVLSAEDITGSDDILGNILLVMKDDDWKKSWWKSKHKSLKDWLMAEYKIYKLTQFEYDLLHSFLYVGNSQFNLYPPLSRMQRKEYFKNIDTEKTIREILENSEVIINE